MVEAMLKSMSRARLAGMWVAAVVVMAVGSVFFGMELNVGNGELWLAACVVPPIVLLLLLPSAQPLTVAQILHSVDGPAKDSRS